MELGLTGRKALITGASKGIGEAIALRFAQEGVHLALVARTAADLAEVKKAIQGRWNVEVQTFALDMSESKNAQLLARECGHFDILVNNAGSIPRGTVEEIDEERWRKAWELKVFGYINMTRAFYALMRKRRSGVIINILGTGGERLDSRYICGSAGNAALIAFTRALGGNSPEDGLRVVGINPGPVATDRLISLLQKEAKDRFGDAERWSELVKPMPFQRAGTPDEIAVMTVLLASDLSAYTSGTVVTIDGGQVHQGSLI